MVVKGFILGLVLAISIVDFVSYKIPNLLSIALFFLLLVDPAPLPASHVLLAAISVLVLAHFSAVGMGDRKLFLALLLSQGSVIMSLEYLNYFFIAILILCLTKVIRDHSFKGSIALGPAILLPFLGVYL